MFHTFALDWVVHSHPHFSLQFLLTSMSHMTENSAQPPQSEPAFLFLVLCNAENHDNCKQCEKGELVMRS